MSDRAFSAFEGRTVVASVEEMQVFAARLVSFLKGGEVLALIGELGSGKTTFVQGVARVLGVQELPTSSSFVVVSEYITKHARIERLIHVDLYRVTAGSRDPAVAAILEQVSQPHVLTVIEWADRLTGVVGTNSLQLNFAYGEREHERVVSLFSS